MSLMTFAFKCLSVVFYIVYFCLDMFDDKFTPFSRSPTSSSSPAGALADVARAVVPGPDSILLLLPNPVCTD